ncbi:MAG TPA: lactonase family protein [Micromonosporaceae bacterium]|nr:lactonase family protein [Micromonosporaceae bacterium]
MTGLVHLGCYTAASGGAGEGVMLARRDPYTGVLADLRVAAATESPSFLARHPTLPVLYAAAEGPEGMVSAWSVAPDGSLTLLSSRSTGGASTCHVAVAPDGGAVACANYASGSVAVHPLDPSGAPGERTDLAVHRGRGPHPERQEGPHAHMVQWTGPRALRAVDLGTDAVYPYTLEEGRLRPAGEPLRAAPGSGPRHLARGSDGWFYLVAELDATVTAYREDPATGRAAEAARVPTSAEAGHVQPSEIAVGGEGRYLYVANRGPDTIAVFALDDGIPRYLTEVSTGGNWPRHFALIEGLLYVANERSHTVVTFQVNASTGVPVPLGEPLEAPSPTCVQPAEVLSCDVRRTAGPPAVMP